MLQLFKNNGVMESRYHFKNGARLKSQMSKDNNKCNHLKKLFFIMTFVVITSSLYAQTQRYDITVRDNTVKLLEYQPQTTQPLVVPESNNSDRTYERTMQQIEQRRQESRQREEQRRQEIQVQQSNMNNEDAQVRSAIAKLMIETQPPSQDQSVFYAPVRQKYVFRTPNNRFYYGTVVNGQIQKTWIN